MNTFDHIDQALNRAREAASARPGRALVPILNALSVIARSGSDEQLREAELLLEGETIASGRHVLTIPPLLEALAVAENRNARWIAACLARRLSWAYDFAGDDVSSMRMAEQSCADFAAMGDTEGYLRSTGNLGALWNRRGDLVEAKRLQEEVLLLAESVQIPMERSRARINLGYTCQLVGDFARSRQLLTEAQSIMGAGSPPVHAAALLNVTRVDIAENKPEQAAKTLQRAQPFIDAGNHFGQIETWLLRGHIATLQARYADAVGCLSEGLKMAQSESTGAPREQVELWQAMSAAQAAAGDYKAALEAMHKANDINASLRRESAVLQAATAAERRAAEHAHREAERARGNAWIGRETLRELEAVQRELSLANAEKERLTAKLARLSH